MHIQRVRNQRGEETILLRESYRQDGKVKKRTVANLTTVPSHAVEALHRALSGETLVGVNDAIEIESSVHHGNVEAVLTAMGRLGVADLISSRPCRERDLVRAMIASRLLAPASKLETARWFDTTSLPEELGIKDTTEDELYAAMDWLLDRQANIEAKLAKRHLEPCGLVLYDLSSTYVEGTKCPIARRGYSRDGKKDKLQINFGLLTDEKGRPVAVSVYEGNVGDPTTVADQVQKLKERFDLDLLVLVGDRGMITQKQINLFIEKGGIEWISALKSGGIQKLKADGSLQLGLFDEKNLFELSSPSFPDERLIACRNPEQAKRRAKKRDALIASTKKELEKVRDMIARGTLSGRDAIGLRIGRVINKYKVAKHFKLEIGEDALHYRVRADKVQAEAALDGIYVIRTSVPKDVITDADAVRHYKRLARVERAFRSIKTVTLMVRPIYHWLEKRVRAHIFLCMLAYYVEWHIRQAWAPLLFTDEVDTRDSRDPVAPARPSDHARSKAATKTTADGFRVHSFRSLLGHMATIVRNRCRRKHAPKAEPFFPMITRADPLHERALQLIQRL
jgi:hypothetical protein